VHRDFPTAATVDRHFMGQWPARRHIRIDDETRAMSVLHVWHGEFGDRWCGRRQSGRWVFRGQTGLDGVLWWHGMPPDFPLTCRLQRIDNGDAEEHVLGDDRLLRQWQDRGILFDVYTRA
jgi:hypothetical protein